MKKFIYNTLIFTLILSFVPTMGYSTEASSDTHTITFNANGGINAPAPQTIQNREFTTLSLQMPTKEGYAFYGWRRHNSGSGVSFYPAGVANNHFGRGEDFTLHAEWVRETDQNNFTFSYNQITKEATLTGYLGSWPYTNPWGIVAIPKNVTYNAQTYSVTAIGDFAFDGIAPQEIIIPNSVRTIGNRAFADSAMNHVVIPDSVITIGNGAFADNHIENLIIPDSIKHIGDFAFYWNRLDSGSGVYMSKSIMYIGKEAFEQVNGASTWLVSPLNPNAVVESGNYFEFR